MTSVCTTLWYATGVTDSIDALCINGCVTVQVAWSVSFVDHDQAFLLSKQRDQLCWWECHAESYSRLGSRSVQALCLSHTHHHHHHLLCRLRMGYQYWPHSVLRLYTQVMCCLALMVSWSWTMPKHYALWRDLVLLTSWASCQVLMLLPIMTILCPATKCVIVSEDALDWYD